MHAATAITPPPPPITTSAAAATMHAIVHPRYGAPDVLVFEEVARPVPGADDVLVRVHAAGVSIGDHHVVTGKPYLIRLSPFGGLPRPKNRVPGTAIAGRVESVGGNVTTIRPGDEVYGEAPSGGFAEYVVVAATRLAPMPSNLTFEEAAATPWAITALQGLRAGGLGAGHRLLVNGASGGVGTWAVQIAKALGAEVTAVCSTRNLAMVRGLGADHVVDYTSDDFVAAEARFDVMLDLVGNRSVSDCKRVLAPRGTYVACSGRGGDWIGPLFRLAAIYATSALSRRKLTTFMAAPNRDDLLALTALVEAGKARPIIERRFPLREAAEALRHVGAGRAQGQTVISVVG